jgi:hypothetical protein
MANPSRPNAGKPWTSEDDATLRQLAAEGAAPSLIAAQLGRTMVAISGRSNKLGLVLHQNSPARAAERRDRVRRSFEEPAGHRADRISERVPSPTDESLE